MTLQVRISRIAAVALTCTVLIAGSPVASFAAPTPKLHISDFSVVEGNGSATLAFKITLAPAKRPASVGWATTDATALAGSDYVTSGGTASLSKTTPSTLVRVPVSTDALDEENETLTVTLSNPVGAKIGDGLGIGTIVDDDASPTLTIGDPVVGEGDVGSTTATFTVSLSAASGRDVSVTYTTVPDTATTPSDYLLASGTLDLPAGSTTGTVDVSVVGDLLDETNEAFSMTLSLPVAATIVDPTGTATIVDDDGVPELVLANLDVSESAGAAVLTIARTGDPDIPVTLHYATNPGTATSPDDYTHSEGDLTMAAGALSLDVSIPVVADLADEPNETMDLVLSAVVGANLPLDTAVITILDDDLTPTALTLKVRKASTRVTARGLLESAVAGLPVKVRLSRKTSSGWVRVATKTVGIVNLLDRDADGRPDGSYLARFARPSRHGTYRIRTAFAGTVDLATSTIAKTFRL